MLKHLKIENYALIDSLEVTFKQGFTVITGETGAGKSILLGALGLVLGNRADPGVVKNYQGKCIVEAIFDIEPYSIGDIFEKNDIDYAPSTILRREITPSGKSRAFVNDTPVNLNLLKTLGDHLVDIHSQHSSLLLNDPSFQLSVIDSYAGINSRVEGFRLKFDEYSDLSDEIKRMEQDETEARREEDYIRFLFEELEKVNLKKDELEQLEEDQKLLSHAEEIKEELFNAVDIVSHQEGSILSKLKEIRRRLEKISGFHKELEDLNARFNSAIIELEDVTRGYESIQDDVEFNPALLEEINERLDLIYKLQHKHSAGSIGELIDLRDKYDLKIRNISSLAGEIEEKKVLLGKIAGELSGEAEAISVKRKAIFSDLESKTAELLARMGMPDGRVTVHHEKLENFDRDGIDEVSLLFTANKGIDPGELSRIASGGELSRLMLSIKSLISEKKLLPTIIFDEIDNGISGDIAGRVGDVMLDAANNMQVIAISHLPQIAGRGQHHYIVYKETVNETTVSRMKKIDDEDRIVEIAKMLSGDEQSTTTRETAREFLKKTGSRN